MINNVVRSPRPERVAISVTQFGAGYWLALTYATITTILLNYLPNVAWHALFILLPISAAFYGFLLTWICVACQKRDRNAILGTAFGIILTALTQFLLVLHLFARRP